MLLWFIVFNFFQLTKAEAYDENNLIFKKDDNQIEISSPVIDYDFSQKSYFYFNGFKVYYDEIRPHLGIIKATYPKVLNKKADYYKLLGLQWPEKLILGQTLSFITPIHGKTLISYSLSEKERGNWSNSRKHIATKNEYRYGKAQLTYYKSVFDFKKQSFGFSPIPQELETIIKKTFRFCVRENFAGTQINLCSPYQKRVSQQKKLSPLIKKASQNIVAYKGKKQKLKGKIEIQEDDFSFSVWQKNGFVLGLQGTSLSNQIQQVLETDQGLELTGLGLKPINAETLINNESLLARYGWRDTILPKESLWRLSLPKESRSIPALPSGSSLISQKILSDRLPKKELHTLTLEKKIRATYNRNILLKGTCSEDCSLTSDSKNPITTEGKSFSWKVQLDDKNQLNQKKILVTDKRYKDQKWVASYDIFRATSSELSIRGSGIATNEGAFSVLLEGNFSHWFESILGWENRIFSKQRWGVSARRFQSISDISLGSGFDVAWAATNVDLKYRLNSGVWGLHETLGIIASYQQNTLGDLSGGSIGAGVFWAKSMPEFFDRLISWLPYMDYPKWVDMDFIIYPVGIENATTIPQPMWSLNFHGKILWSPSFFGELGFGMKQVDLVSATADLQFKFGAAYMTAGIGLQF